MDIVTPFAKSVGYVLEMNFSARPQWGRPAAHEAYPVPVGRGVVARVGVTGALDGVMAVGLHEKTALGIAAAYGGARNVSHVNDEVQSLLREFINMASGNAIARLAEKGLVCDITTPEVITGRSLAIHCAPPVRTVALPFSLNREELILFLTLRRTDSGPQRAPLAWRVF